MNRVGTQLGKQPGKLRAAAASFADVLAREAASTPSAADEAEALLQLGAAGDPGRGKSAQ